MVVFFKNQSTSKMKLFVIIFISSLSFSKAFGISLKPLALTGVTTSLLSTSSPNNERSTIQSSSPKSTAEPLENVTFNSSGSDAPNGLLWKLWNKLKQCGRCFVKTMFKVRCCIVKAVQKGVTYMTQGYVIMDSLHEAAESAENGTRHSDNRPVKIINSFLALSKTIFKNIKGIFQSNAEKLMLEKVQFELAE